MDIYWINYITKMLCYMEFGHGMTILRIVIPHPDRWIWQLAWQFIHCHTDLLYGMTILRLSYCLLYGMTIPRIVIPFQCLGTKFQLSYLPLVCHTDCHTFPWFVILVVIPILGEHDHAFDCHTFSLVPWQCF